MITEYARRLAAAAIVCCVLDGSAGAEELSLGRAVELALKNNPTIAAGDLSADAAGHRAQGARALANPEIIVAPSFVGDAGADSALLWSQPLEINGSRRVRGQIAAYEASAAKQDALVVTRDVVLDVKLLYWDVVEAQELVELNRKNIDYVRTIDAAVRKQLDVGATPGSSVIKSEVELANARQQLSRAQLELRQARSALGTTLGCPIGSDFTAADPLTFTEMPLGRDKLMAACVSRRPEVASGEALVAAANRRIKAARLEALPDIAIQARKESFADGDGGFAVALTLPILDWGSVRAEKRQARSEALARQKELEALRNQAALDVEQGIHAVETASGIVQEYHGGILDKSESLAAMAQKGYEKGAIGYLGVLEAQRTLLGARTGYISALADHARAAARLEWATCSPLGVSEVQE